MLSLLPALVFSGKMSSQSHCAEPKFTVYSHIASTCGPALRPTLQEESRAMFNSNHAFLLVQKLKSASQVRNYTRNQGPKKKIFSICPKSLITCVGSKAKEKDTIKFGKPVCNPCGQCCSIY